MASRNTRNSHSHPGVSHTLPFIPSRVRAPRQGTATVKRPNQGPQLKGRRGRSFNSAPGPAVQGQLETSSGVTGAQANIPFPVRIATDFRLVLKELKEKYVLSFLRGSEDYHVLGLSLLAQPAGQKCVKQGCVHRVGFASICFMQLDVAF